MRAIATATAASLDALAKMEVVMAMAWGTSCLFQLVSGVCQQQERQQRAGGVEEECENVPASAQRSPRRSPV